NVLGKTTFSGEMAAGAGTTVDVDVSGIVQFRDRPVWAVVDAARSIPELDEANNTLATGLDSHYQPPVADWLPRVEWQWDNAPGGANGVFHAPLVAPLIDTNGDGRVNERDIPAVIANVNGGVGGITRLVALRGDTGQEIFSIFNPVHGFSDATP